MRISAAKTRNSRRPGSGFTLLEMVIVLLILAVTIGGAVTFMIQSSDERQLRESSDHIELLAKRARTISILHQTPYAIEFRPGRVKLLPLAESGVDERTTALGRTIGGERVELAGPTGRQPVREEVVIDNDQAMFIRRWNSDALLPMSDRIIHIWRFDPDGLCEPVTVRLERGDSWMSSTFHPLTATVPEDGREFEFR